MAASSTEQRDNPERIVLHVLCPSLPTPRRITFNDIPLSATIAYLKSRLSESIPSRPSSDQQRLLYMGKPVSDDQVTLQSLFEPLDGSVYTMHLALPPSASPLPASSTGPTTSNSQHPNAVVHNPAADSRLLEQGLRHRAPNPLNTQELAQRLQDSARRRLVELSLQQQQEQRSRLLSQARYREATSTSLLPSISQQLPRPPSTMPSSSGAGPAHFVSPPNLSAISSSDTLELPEEARPRLSLLTQYISLAEEQLNCGIVPTIEHIVQLRTHLFKLLDDQFRQPSSEHIESIEPLITRVFNVSTRADMLRQPRLLTVHATPSGTSAPLYLLSSPSGYQSVLASPAAANPLRSLGTGHNFETSTIGAQPPNAQPDANAAVLENVVRQAVLNQRPAADGQFGIGRNLRRLWLFVRLYLFCHMFSAPGSQTRTIYVVLAVIAAILSETSVPRRIYEMVFVPVQRHLEGLAHFTPEEHTPPRAEATGDPAATAQQAEVQDIRGANWTAGLYQNLRRVERSAALFIASLVPGVGERHIEVRNAAEAARNTELARQEEERRRQEEAAAAEENPTQADETQNATGHEPQPMIPQEVVP
ncbi:hypothetical protein BJX99DRAFT_217913 [Aspergillus californicus]